ncbi:MAG: hypothetical protein M3198_04255 [Actinomycetota bacterium]|nr:hypothetical protein [Actinomycetota bacterium]
MGAFRRGLLIGLGIGYVQGAKAGRDKYEQLKDQFEKVTGLDAVKQVTDKVSSVADTGLAQGKEALNKAVSTTKDKIGLKDKGAEGGSDTSSSASGAGTTSGGSAGGAGTASGGSAGGAGTASGGSAGGVGTTSASTSTDTTGSAGKVPKPAGGRTTGGGSKAGGTSGGSSS